MKAYVKYSGWAQGIFAPEREVVNIAGRTTAYVDATAGWLAHKASWTPVDQSDFINWIDQIHANPAEKAWELEEQFRAAFGYAQRVSELCQRLEKIEVTLLDVVKKLDSTQSLRSLWVPIESFAPEPYQVLRPITAVVTPVEDGFEAGIFDANLFSAGDTEVEAVNNLKSRILETYTALEQLGDSKLGPGPLRQRKTLSSMIRRIGS